MIRFFKNISLEKIVHARNNSLVSHYLESDDINIIKVVFSKFPCIIIGNTTKMFFAFKTKDIYLIKYCKNEIVEKDNLLIVDSGVNLPDLGKYAVKKGIKGFEKVFTIPGKVGGSIINNASFLNQSITDYLLFLEIIDQNGNYRIIRREEILINYRNIKIINIEGPFIIAKAIFKIEKTFRKILYEERNKAIRYRVDNQPKIHSLGSTFKNPPNSLAYQLIDQNINFDKVGEYQICPTHKNFIILGQDLDNLNLVKLIERIQEVLYNNKGLFLENEINIIY